LAWRLLLTLLVRSQPRLTARVGVNPFDERDSGKVITDSDKLITHSERGPVGDRFASDPVITLRRNR
jgi:hypothetical protein